MEKLDPKKDGSTPDIVEQNIEVLRRLFPDAFTESSEEDQPRWKVDIDALKDILGDYAEDKKERYSFTWNGKARARRISQTPSTGTLRPCPEESINWDTTQNLFIEGDNLEVLKLLQKSYHKKVKMIYIDPPYNTGKDFIYPDDFRDNIKNYLELTGQTDNEGRKLTANAETSGRYHTNWLNMMYPRLKLARNLLRDDGVIFISIDDNEVANLRKMCDEIFGEENLLAELVWHLSSGSQAGHFTRAKEFIITYSKNRTNLPYFVDTSGGKIKHGALKKISAANPASEIFFRKGSIEFEGGDAEFQGEIGGSEKQCIVGGKLIFRKGRLAEDVTIKAGWAMKNQILSWLEGKETYDSKGQRVLRFYFNSKGILFYEKERETIHPKTVLPANVGNTKTGTDEMNELFGTKLMDFPKPSTLMRFLCKLVCTQKNELTLDFFAGSSGTAHSVIDLNNSDGGNRKFIMVQLPETTDEKSEAFNAGYKTIADIGKERIRRVINKIKSERTERANESQKSLLKDEEDAPELDLGFKVFKLDASNIKPWDADFDTLEQDLLDAVDNIKPGRSEEDILYELLLKYGLDLAVPIEERNIAGKTVYVIGAGALIVCLDNDVNLEVVEGIAALKEELKPEIMRVVFKDSGFEDDVVKTNAVQILSQADINDVKSL